MAINIIKLKNCEIRIFAVLGNEQLRCKQIEADRKWPPFFRRHFQIIFLLENCYVNCHCCCASWTIALQIPFHLDLKVLKRFPSLTTTPMCDTSFDDYIIHLHLMKHTYCYRVLYAQPIPTIACGMASWRKCQFTRDVIKTVDAQPFVWHFHSICSWQRST